MVLDKEKLDVHNFMNVILKQINPKYHNLDVAIRALKLPFFFDKDDQKFYRFEGYIYHYNYEPMFRNFSVDINLGLKIKTKFLMSIFMNLSSEAKLLSKNFTIFNSFLLKNGFGVNIKSNTALGNLSDNV